MTPFPAPRPSGPSDSRPQPEPSAVLFPLPRRVRSGLGHLDLPASADLQVQGLSGSDAAALDWGWALGPAWECALARPNAPGQTHLQFARDPQLAAQAYRLDVDREGIRIAAADARGWWYGALTLHQWMLAHGQRGPHAALRLTELHVADEPKFPRRGYMLDISRDRIPTVPELKRRIERVAELKGNHVEFYMEHTFAYRGHEAVHAGFSPLRPSEVRELVTHAATLAIEVVPNQNTFGHMHRWLRQPKYRPLAEEPAGDFHAFDYLREPFSLCPTDPASLRLVEDLLGQLLPCFPSPLFNAGLDETFDVGRGRSQAAVAQRGLGTVFVEYLQKVAQLARKHGKRPVYWADILLEHPEVLKDLPRDGIAVLWGYEADHPFETQAQALKAAGQEFWIAPGTSAWQSLTGRWHNAQVNIDRAIACGLQFGAAGMVLTDWGDYGHWQPAGLAEPAVLYFFGSAWNDQSAPKNSEALAHLLNLWRYEGNAPELAAVHMQVVCASAKLGDGARNGTGPFYSLRYPPHGPNRKENARDRAPAWSAAGAAAYAAESKHLRAALRQLPHEERARFGQEIEELDWCLDAALWATELASARFDGDPIKPDQIQTCELLAQRYAALWAQTSRPGGLFDSLRKWRHALSPEEWQSHSLRDPNASPHPGGDT